MRTKSCVFTVVVVGTFKIELKKKFILCNKCAAFLIGFFKTIASVTTQPLFTAIVYGGLLLSEVIKKAVRPLPAKPITVLRIHHRDSVVEHSQV